MRRFIITTRNQSTSQFNFIDINDNKTNAISNQFLQFVHQFKNPSILKNNLLKTNSQKSSLTPSPIYPQKYNLITFIFLLLLIFFSDNHNKFNQMTYILLIIFQYILCFFLF